MPRTRPISLQKPPIFRNSRSWLAPRSIPCKYRHKTLLRKKSSTFHLKANLKSKQKTLSLIILFKLSLKKLKIRSGFRWMSSLKRTKLNIQPSQSRIWNGRWNTWMKFQKKVSKMLRKRSKKKKKQQIFNKSLLESTMKSWNELKKSYPHSIKFWGFASWIHF